MGDSYRHFNSGIKLTQQGAARTAGLPQTDQPAGADQLTRDRPAFLPISLNFAELQVKIDRLVEGAKADRNSVGRACARGLLTLNCLMFRDMALHYHRATNSA
ncbi:MAG TPA: hypothetical protein EYP14_05145 [Planctomycetaceae bacterium]|nr:hypothetical protein [Planctomycetaceae bacterium]